MPPPYLRTDVTFLGQPVDPGVNPTMAERLQAAESHLWARWSATGSRQPFESWGGLREPLRGWRSRDGFHASGSAVDLNPSTGRLRGEVADALVRAGHLHRGDGAVAHFDLGSHGGFEPW